MQIQNRFPLEEAIVPSLGILGSIAAHDLTKDQISIANVALHFPHFVPEGHLEAILKV